MSDTTRRAARGTFLAASMLGAAFAASPAGAQEASAAPPQQADAGRPGDVIVTGVTDQPGRQLESPKRTRPLRDTPQTVTVLTQDVLQQQNILSLRDALATVPGITFGAGEGGSGYGDSINLRGYSANNDITIDGVRDSAQYSRSDNFDIEQIEVTNGADSVYSGAGSIGGNINLVTKRPNAHDSAVLQGGLGTADYHRATADIDHALTDSVAVRLNGMYHHNRIPGRDVEKNDRWGIAPAITVGLDSPTRATLLYFHQQDRNIPQYGVPYISSTANGFVGQVPGTSRGGYYGFRNLDTQRIGVDQVTAILEHDVTDKVTLRNLSRYQNVTQFSIADGPEGTFCLPTGFTAAGVACATPGFFVPTGGSRGNTRDTRNQLTYNQTDLKGVVSTFGIEHTIDLGVSLSQEFYDVRSGNSQRNADGTAVAVPNYTLGDPNANTGNVYKGLVNFIVSARNHSKVDNYAAYLFDAVKLGDHVELNGGVRIERNTGEFTTNTISTVAATLGQTTATTVLGNRNTLFSYRIGAVYKPVTAVSLYVAYGNSRTPSQSTVNGSCTTATCDVKPEGAKNYEIGGKAELFNGGLLLTASLFRTDRDSYKVASNDPNIPDQQLDGHSRVDGVALGASGHFTPAWSITANYTHLTSDLIQSVSNSCIAAPRVACANNALFPDPARDAELTQTPEDSGSLYTAYAFPFHLTVGYGATYQGRFAINLPTIVAAGTPATVTAGTTLTPVLFSRSYLVHNLTLAYNFTRRIALQLNVKNVGDKLYYTRIRSGNGWATPGDARSAVFTLIAGF